MPNDHQLTDLDVQLATIQETAKTERQKNLLNLLGTVLNAAIGIGNAFLIIHNSSQVGEVKEAATTAAVKAEEAQTSIDSVVKTAHKRDESLAELKEGVNANLIQWKAYKSKEPEDEKAAAKALDKVDMNP